MWLIITPQKKNLANSGAEETQQAFALHFTRELATYGQQCVVSLVEQSGKEKIIGDAFLEQILLLDEPRLLYATFDFHQHWYANIWQSAFQISLITI